MSDTFESARLRIRLTRIEDAEALHEAYRDADLMRYWSSGPHADLAETQAYIAPRIALPDWRGWTMIRKEDDRVIGTLFAGQRRAGVSEIGYLLVRSASGQGYAREGVSQLIDLLIREERHRRVFADTDPDNIASNRLLERLGFTREGRLRGEWETHIGVRHSYIWGLLAEEWTARPPFAQGAGEARLHLGQDAIALPLRRAGLAFVGLGLLIAIIRHLWAPGMPIVIAMATLALGALNLAGAVVVRVAYGARPESSRRA